MSLPDIELIGSEFSLANLQLPTDDVMMRRIVSLSGGLIESKWHREDQIIQFIHQSVNDFLLRDGLRLLDKNSPDDPIGQGHHQLSLICANYIRMADIGNSNELDAKSIKAQLQFVDYATISWLLHAEKAETQGVPQDYLLRYGQHCPNMLEQWVRLYKTIDPFMNSRKPEQSSTILHIASSANLLSVVEGLLPTHPDLEQEGNSGNRPLHCASRWGHTKVVEALVAAGAFMERENKSNCTPLERVAANGHEEVVGFLLAKGADVNQQTGETGNALYGAAAKGNRAIVQNLLGHKAEVNARGGLYGNALQAAVYRDHQGVVQLLLDSKADVNAQGGLYGNAFQAAVYKGNQEIIQLLIDNKAEVNNMRQALGNDLSWL